MVEKCWVAEDGDVVCGHSGKAVDGGHAWNIWRIAVFVVCPSTGGRSRRWKIPGARHRSVHPDPRTLADRRNFSETGNFGFGIEEHIDLGIKYDPGIGIFGMDFFVVMGRPGMRVARRKAKTGRVGSPHKVRPEQTIAWFKQRFDGIVAR